MLLKITRIEYLLLLAIYIFSFSVDITVQSLLILLTRLSTTQLCGFLDASILYFLLIKKNKLIGNSEVSLNKNEIL